MGAMVLLINVMNSNEYVAKIITQIIVILANYFQQVVYFKETEVLKKK